VAAAALIAAPLTPAGTAAASCVAPSLTVKPARVARGAELTITGQYLGDDCLDTGTLPPGIGPLGNPLTGLLVVIDQGPKEFQVATGSADSKYEFEVKVVVPPTLEPGDASVNLIGVGDARLTTTVPIVISSASPITSGEANVATFGPPTTPDTEPIGTDPSTPLPAEIPDQPIATSPPPPISSAPIEEDSNRGDMQRAIAVGVAGIVAIGATVFAVRGRLRKRGW
jgi:hypothetical protein